MGTYEVNGVKVQRTGLVIDSDIDDVSAVDMIFIDGNWGGGITLYTFIGKEYRGIKNPSYNWDTSAFTKPKMWFVPTNSLRIHG